MVITPANIIGAISRTIIGDIVPTMGATTIRTGITATPVVLASALMFYSTDQRQLVRVRLLLPMIAIPQKSKH